MANFLQTLLAGASAAPAAARPGLTPEWFAEVVGPQAAPVSQPAPQSPGLTPEWFEGVMAEEQPGKPVNLLEGIAEFSQPQAGGMPDAAPTQPARAPRERRTVLDTVGRIADVLAKVGGAEALYQPSLDAREDRRFAIEDRTRAVDLDKLKYTLAQRQVEDGSTERLALGVRGLQAIAARGGDPSKAWPLIAQQIGLDPTRTAAIGEAITADPSSIFGLNAALNGTPEMKQGSQAKEAQIYAMLNKESPELGRTYLQSLANPDSMTPYQQAQLGVARERLGLARDAEERQARTAEQKSGEGGGSQLNPTQRGAVAQTRESIPGIRATLSRVEQLSKQMQGDDGTIARGYVGGMVPGQLAGGSAAEFDKAAGLLAAQIRTLIRTAGEGSMSDFESRLALLPMPSRTDSDEGRAEAIRNFRSLLSEVESRSNRLLTPARPAARPRTGGGGGQPPRTAPPRRSAPAKKPAAPSSGWGKATVVS